MSRQRRLTRAPIVEALIDVQVEPRSDLTFEELQRAEAERWWAFYVDRLEPQWINRVAVRFINDLQLPVPVAAPVGASFARYIDCLMEIPKEIPQRVEGFVQRFQLGDEGSDAQVIVTLALGPGESAQKAPVILDIDAFVGVRFAARDGSLWEHLEHLRALKNRCFFGIVSEAALELYE